ncbi:Endoribonuclease L-PSP/chorismate mutase-like protein [Trichoderma compactum]
MSVLFLIISSLVACVLATSKHTLDDAAAGPIFIGTPGFEQNLSTDFHYSQAVRSRNYLVTDIATQVNNAFDSLTLALKAAGSSNGLADLISINSYHVVDIASGLGNVTAVMGKRIPKLVEIQAEAWIK